MYVFRAAYPYSRFVHTNFVNYTVISILMLILVLSMAFGIKEVMVYAAIYFLYAVVQGGLPNVLTALLTRRYTTTENGFLMGLWAASGSIGSIFVSLLFTAMIFYMKLDWKWCFIVAPVLVFISSGMLKLFEEEL